MNPHKPLVFSLFSTVGSTHFDALSALLSSTDFLQAAPLPRPFKLTLQLGARSRLATTTQPLSLPPACGV